MPPTLNRGARTAPAREDRLRSTMPPAAIIAVIVLIVGALGAGIFYLVNEGWQTDAQKKYQFEHETAPIIAARRGRPELLEQENARRQAAGQPPLVVKDRHEGAGDMRQGLQALQSRMGGGQAAGGP